MYSLLFYAALGRSYLFYRPRYRFQEGRQENKVGCFIATAVLNSEHTEQLAVLSNFRDQLLMSSVLGRRIVRTYYRLSPPLAAFLQESRVAKTIIRRCFVLPVAHFVRAWWFVSGAK